MHNHIHTYFTHQAIQSLKNDSIMQSHLPDIHPFEKSLPQEDRFHLAWLRCGYYPAHQVYRNRWVWATRGDTVKHTALRSSVLLGVPLLLTTNLFVMNFRSGLGETVPDICPDCTLAPHTIHHYWRLNITQSHSPTTQHNIARFKQYPSWGALPDPLRNINNNNNNTMPLG